MSGHGIGTSALSSVLPMNIQLISFRIDWFDLLSVQGILKSLLQQHSSKASILRRSAFFVVHLPHSCMITGKTNFDYTDLCQQRDVFAFEYSV